MVEYTVVIGIILQGIVCMVHQQHVEKDGICPCDLVISVNISGHA